MGDVAIVLVTNVPPPPRFALGLKVRKTLHHREHLGQDAATGKD